jgi:protein-S-isoprenylcysteine O-methyltransferase Ste14
MTQKHCAVCEEIASSNLVRVERSCSFLFGGVLEEVLKRARDITVSFTPEQFIYGSWILFCAYWLISAFGAVKTAKREAPVERLSHVIFMAAGYVLLFERSNYFGVLNERFMPDVFWIDWLGSAITLAGVLFAIWARQNLGKYWSGAVTIKEGHQIIRTGPYSHIRHPIYTGMLIAIIGTALTVGEYRALLAFAIFLFGFVRKARKEEAFLAANFGDSFQEHRRRTGFFLPRVSGNGRL